MAHEMDDRLILLRVNSHVAVLIVPLRYRIVCLHVVAMA